MSIYGALYSGVSGLTGFSTAVSIAADNIANLNVYGYKAGEVQFNTMITSSNSSTLYSSGGVSAKNRQLVDVQGLIQNTGSATDIAMSGDGFFVVNTAADGSGDFLYTRAGSFKNDATGNFVNTAGYYLFAWPLSNTGMLPGSPGNLDTTSSALLESTQAVNVKSVTGSASASTTISLGLNLKESQTVLQGAGEILKFPSTSGYNYNVASLDPIYPSSSNSGNNAMNIGDSITLTPSDPGTIYNFEYGGLVVGTDLAASPQYGASTTQSVFVPGAGTTGSTFTITNNGTTYTYSYIANSPEISAGQFNSLSTLAQAINETTGLSARTCGTQLVVSPHDATQDLVIADTNGAMATNLGLACSITPQGYRFANLQGLSNLMNSSLGLTSIVNNPLSGSSLQFYATDPLGTLSVSTSAGQASGAAIPSNLTNATTTTFASTELTILSELGLSTTGIDLVTIPNVTSNSFGPAYDASGSTAPNMAGGHVVPQFSRNIRIYDSFGTGHDFQISFAKTDVNTWAVEMYSAKPLELGSSRADGQVAAGSVVFNGDGSLRTVSATLTNPINIIWANQAEPSNITVDWGTAGQITGTIGALSIGKTDGLRQLDSAYNVDFADQNGIAPGLLTSVTIDSNGFVIAHFSNGSSKSIFQLPIAKFENPDGLQNNGGNAYAETTQSGEFNLKEANSGGVGTITPGALEQSNVELSDQLTNMLIYQRGYQANTKVIQTASDMLEDLNNIRA